MEDESDLFIFPIGGARTCVNGTEVKDRTRLFNGDRILWGSNHFFRVNCPKNTDPGNTYKTQRHFKSVYPYIYLSVQGILTDGKGSVQLTSLYYLV
jgi:hypothetical protein